MYPGGPWRVLLGFDPTFSLILLNPEGNDTAQVPVGLLGTRPFRILHFFDCTEESSFSLHDLLSVPMSRFNQFLIREGREWETRDKQPRAAFGQGPDSPSMGT